MFGLFNGMCVLPVLLSWFGPDPYLNATRIKLTSDMNIMSGTREGTHEPMTEQIQLKSIAELSDSDSKSEQHFNGNITIQTSNCEELSELLDTLEKASAIRQHTASLHDEEPKSHHDIIQNCQEYLATPR